MRYRGRGEDRMGRNEFLFIGIVLMFLTSCLDQNSQQSSSTPGAETIDDGGIYPKTQFYIADMSGNRISKDQASNQNLILLCEQKSGFCQNICVNQLWYSQPFKRYALLWSGYQFGGTCSAYVFGHNADDGLPSYKFYSGVYVQPTPPSVLGYCSGISVANPNKVGRYEFTENRVAEGSATPDPFGRRLFYALDVQDENGNPAGRTYVRAYEPVQGSGAVLIFSYLIGGVEATWQSVNGFSCVKESEILDSTIQTLQ